MRSGQTYTLTATDLTTSSRNAQMNEITGDDRSSETDLHESSRLTTIGGTTISVTAVATALVDSTANEITGAYARTVTETSTSTTSETGLLSIEKLTATSVESGSHISGTYTESGSSTDDMTLNETATDVDGAFTATQSVHDVATNSGAGNEITGDTTTTESGTQTYSFLQIQTGTNAYTLTESGSKSYSLTDTASLITGASTENETASDHYTLDGSTGEDDYSKLEIANDLE